MRYGVLGIKVIANFVRASVHSKVVHVKKEMIEMHSIVKVTVEDIHELDWVEGQSLKDMPKAKLVFIGEVVEDNNKYVILRYSRFHPNTFNLPLKNVGVYLPKSLIVEIVKLMEVPNAK